MDGIEWGFREGMLSLDIAFRLKAPKLLFLRMNDLSECKMQHARGRSCFQRMRAKKLVAKNKYQKDMGFTPAI